MFSEERRWLINGHQAQGVWVTGRAGMDGVAAVDGADAILRDSLHGFTFQQSGNS